MSPASEFDEFDVNDGNFLHLDLDLKTGKMMFLAPQWGHMQNLFTGGGGGGVLNGLLPMSRGLGDHVFVNEVWLFVYRKVSISEMSLNIVAN